MNWTKIVMKSDSNEQLVEIGQVFDALYLAAGCPADMALYAKGQRDGRLELYFSPTASHYAAEIVHQFKGQTCDAPQVNELELVDGPGRLWWQAPVSRQLPLHRLPRP